MVTFPKIEGIITALITPLTKEEELDCGLLEALVERQLAAGVQALFVNGSVGEGPMMPDSLYGECVKRVIDQVAGRVLVLGGAIDNSTSRCLERIKTLANLGADAAVVTLPYYGWQHDTTRALDFFSTLAQKGALPLVAYNLPKVSGCSLEFAAMVRLFHSDGLVGVKDTRVELEEMIQLAGHTRLDHIGYYPGNSGFMLPLLEAGADGIVSTPANLLPELYTALYDACRKGEREKAQRLDAANQELVNLLQLPNGPAGIKGVLETLGQGTGICFPPWPQSTFSEKESARKAYEKALQLWEMESKS